MDFFDLDFDTTGRGDDVLICCVRSESVCSTSSQTSSEMSDSSATADRSSRQQHSGTNYHGLDFQLIVENKSGNGPGKVVHLVAPSMQDKAAWISDISQVYNC